MPTTDAMVRRETGFGRYVAAENDLVITAPTYKSGGPLCILCHGAGQTPANYAPQSASYDLDYLAWIGFVVMVADLGGINTWGLDTVVHPSTGRIQALRTWAAGAPYNADITRTVLIGDSMGGQNAILYHRLAPANVKASLLRCPVVAADALHDRDGAGLGALMDTAYGSTANWEAAVPTKDPSHSNQTSVITTFKDRVRIYYSTNDPTILPADVTSFCAATGVRAIPTGAVAHSPTASIHAKAQAEWLWARANS
jgi:pimeloyl-ACP methyl ester carboxylesterase